MKAVVLAAGDGTRLAPLTTYIPKSMIPIAGKPVVRIIVEKLKKAGFINEDIVVVCLDKFFKSYQHELRDMKGIGIVGFKVNKGTATHYMFADECFKGESKPNEAVLIHYGDIITDMDYREFMLNWDFRDTLLLATTRNVRHDYSEVKEWREVTGKRRSISFVEKPKLPYPTWTGIMIANRRRMLEYITSKVIDSNPDRSNLSYAQYLEFAVDIFPLIIEKEEESVKTYEYKGEWYDLGNLRSYTKLWEKYITEDLAI